MRVESVTQPKIPPCALIIRSPTSWNSGKYDAQQSDSTMQRKPRSFASRAVVLTQTANAFELLIPNAADQDGRHLSPDDPLACVTHDADLHPRRRVGNLPQGFAFA